MERLLGEATHRYVELVDRRLTKTPASSDPGMLAAALDELVTMYPTDDIASTGGAKVTITGAGVDRTTQTVRIQPGQNTWLTELLLDESATCRNAHTDGNGQCAHCQGTGSAASRRADA